MGGWINQMVNQTSISPVIVRLSENSAADLARIELESNTPPWSAKLFAGEFEQKHSLVFGARAAGQLVGFLVVHFTWDEAHIVNFGILRSFRRQGVGRTLLDTVVCELNSRGVRWVTLEVRKSNVAAIGLYGSFGFSEVGLRERYYSDNQEDGLVMSLNIRQYLDTKLALHGNTAANG